MLSPHMRSHSLIHDVSDTEAFADNELNHYQDELQNALQNQIKYHRSNSLNPLPNLSSMPSLKLDAKIAPFRKPFLSRTPTLKNTETKQLCEKLDNINVIVNDINQYIKNHKVKHIKNDKFLIEKLTEIQDDIEDGEIYIDEHIDAKFSAFAAERSMLEMDTERERTQNLNRKKEIRELQERIQSLEREKQQLMLLKKQHTEISIISRLSSLSHINESEHDTADEKEGKVAAAVKYEENIKELKEKWDLQSKHKEIQMKREIYRKHYQEMHAFIAKIFQPKFRLPRQVIEILSEAQSKLIANNKEIGVALDKEERNVMNERLKLIGHDPNTLEKDGDDDDDDDDLSAVYKEKYVQHKQLIKERMNELRGLNMGALQLKLDIMDVLNQNKSNRNRKGNRKRHCSYDVFLERLIHSISRIFFDAKVILSNVNNAATCTQTDFCEKDNYDDENERGYKMSPEIYHAVNKIPLTLKIIQLTDILSNPSSSLLSLDELKSYVLNIEHFRLLLVENGLDEFEFIEKLAIQLIHCGIIKKKGRKKYHHKIQLISSIFLSIIARDLVLFENDIDSFIDLIVLMVKYPPVLDQINISSRDKKRHKHNLKNILNETQSASNETAASTKEMDLRDAIKTYYNLYSNRILIKNLKRFEKYMRNKAGGGCRRDSGYGSSDSMASFLSSPSCSSSLYSSSSSATASGDDSADDYYYKNIHKQKEMAAKQKQTNQKSLINVFNHLFVKCID